MRIQSAALPEAGDEAAKFVGSLKPPAGPLAPYARWAERADTDDSWPETVTGDGRCARVHSMSRAFGTELAHGRDTRRDSVFPGVVGDPSGEVGALHA